MALGFYINNKNCYGCKTCSMACLTTNLADFDNVFMRKVTTIMPDGTTAFAFASVACNHCENPACMEVCPVSAYTKLENGIVKQHHDLCIGCQSCVNACPYGAPQFNESDGTTYKCDLCYDRLERGELPACVEACPGANIEYGEIDELKAAHPDVVQSIEDVLPSPEETQPNLLIEIDPKLA